MSNSIKRFYSSSVVTIPNGSAVSDVLEVREFAGGVVSMPAAWTAANIGFKHCAAPNGTFQPLRDATGALVEIVASAAGEFVLPDALFACQFVQLWSESAGSNVNQGADRPITVSLKR